MRGTTDTSTPSSWQRGISRLTRASATDEKATIRYLTPVRSTASSRSSIVPSTGTSRPPTSATERGSSSRKPTGASPYSGWFSSRRATWAPTTPAPMIRTGLPIRRLARARRWASASTRAAEADADQGVEPRADPLSLFGHFVVEGEAQDGDGHRRDRDAADHRHDPVEDLRAQLRAVEARAGRRAARPGTASAAAGRGVRRCRTGSPKPPSAITSASHTIRKSTIGRTMPQPEPSSAHCSGPWKVPRCSARGVGAS